MTGFWEGVCQLGISLALVAGIFTSIGVLLAKTKAGTTVMGAIVTRQRLKTCPQKAAFDHQQAKQDGNIKALTAEVTRLADCSMYSQGAQIVMYCMLARMQGYLSRYDRVWLQNLYDDYIGKGGNHGVTEIFEETMRLPLHPKK